jgi:hypothetical protein
LQKSAGIAASFLNARLSAATAVLTGSSTAVR